MIIAVIYHHAAIKLDKSKYLTIKKEVDAKGHKLHERTFALIKPHAVLEKKTGKIIDMIESVGFDIIALEKITLTSDFVY
jgi:hypothetical protein